MDAILQIKHGMIIPWRDGDDRLFEPYVIGIRKLRADYVKGSLDELYAKLLGNGLYGKTAQGLKSKTVFEARTMKSVELQHSVVTNAAIAAHTTGFIRAVLSEQIASIPPHRTVISATEIEARCLQLSKNLRLPLCGLDLKLSPDHEYYCFEVNPSPGYSYYQANTGQDIASAIVRCLSQPISTVDG